MDLNSNVIIESRDVEFIENKFNYDSSLEQVPSMVQLDNLNSTSTQNKKRENFEAQTEPRRSQRQRKEKTLDPDFISSQAIVFLVEGDRNIVLNKIPIIFNTEEDPKTFSEAMASRDASFWKEAINDEMDSILSN